jgi:hypothetical protein
MTKKQLLLILNVYQNYYNDFNNISKTDLDNIYKAVAFKDMSENIDEYLKEEIENN